MSTTTFAPVTGIAAASTGMSQVFKNLAGTSWMAGQMTGSMVMSEALKNLAISPGLMMSTQKVGIGSSITQLLKGAGYEQTMAKMAGQMTGSMVMSEALKNLAISPGLMMSTQKAATASAERVLSHAPAAIDFVELIRGQAGTARLGSELDIHLSDELVSNESAPVYVTQDWLIAKTIFAVWIATVAVLMLYQARVVHPGFAALMDQGFDEAQWAVPLWMFVFATIAGRQSPR